MRYKSAFFFGTPPFKLLASRLVCDEDFLADMQLVVGLSEDRFLHLTGALEKLDAFISRDVLDATVSHVLAGESDAGKLAAAIYRISEVLHDADMPTQDAMRILSEAITGEEKPFNSEERRTLVERLRRLAVVPNGLGRQFKAQKLAVATGAELDQANIICDIRPIFDSSRHRVEGALPVVILRLDYTTSGGESEVLEVRMSEKQIARLEETVATAKRKVAVVKELLKSQSIPVPSTEATR